MADLNTLLRWSIANSTTSPQAPPTQSSASLSALHPSDPLYRLQNGEDISPASTPGPATPVNGASALPNVPHRSDLTSEMLDVIMGKPDSAVMKEKMEIAMDESREVDERVEALDDFEMLIEFIDNANNMAVLKLWKPILELLQSPHPSIVSRACWVIGTAVQNNLKAQAALYLYEALPLLLPLIYPESSSTSSQPSFVRAKATYAFSSALKHWPLASSALSANSSSGYSVLKQGVIDPEPVIRRKMAFLVGTLVMQSGEKYEGELPNEVRNLIEERMRSGTKSESLVDGLKAHGVFTELLKGLKEVPEGDFEYEENAIRTLVRAVEKGGLSPEEKNDLRAIWENRGALGQEERGLGGEDGVEIARILA
ncbi:nucleotide exchange factor Fes1-domain-containing protein [Naematelia encephala]|uniref:Nucleotide exchange factor Fes1-domain-containing protein n=1 Tax=Naematelia encephala TaxID=71784 RepID=A0A1Y2APR0_9TREE|nr:nucleotide exchange factor Fes1-domain-containing protein [Naematelia encephala]